MITYPRTRRRVGAQVVRASWRGLLGAAVLAGASALTVITSAPAAADRDHGPTNVVRIVQTSGGPVIANSAGMTLYVFVNDLLTTAPSACIGDCRNDWPPAMAHGKVHVAPGITGRIGTVERFGQGHQLTMDGRPLYTFSGDSPDQIRGNGVGNLWWAMTPTGLAATSYPSDPSTYGSAKATTLTVVQTRFGPVVANSRGQVLYDYADDTPTASACQAQWCLVDWPPLQAQGTPTAVASITANITVIDGAGGVPQVTLGGHPLYTFAGDLHPGDARGEGIGSDWYLVAPDGQTVTGSESH
jgi:predicted lipoprotein with Yx(FWY)xxD motif